MVKIISHEPNRCQALHYRSKSHNSDTEQIILGYEKTELEQMYSTLWEKDSHLWAKEVHAFKLLLAFFFFFSCILIATLVKSSQFQNSPYLLLDYAKTEGMITVYQRLSCNHSEQMWEIGFRNCSFEDANISKVEKQAGRE